MAASGGDAQPVGVVHSEFAQVAVSIDDAGNGPRLRLEDLKTGHVSHLDALELETIAWLPREHLEALLDPSSDRWREDDAQDVPGAGVVA